MENIFVYFIPSIDENDGKLIYVAEPFIKVQHIEKAIIVMPFKFSIIRENEKEVYLEVERFWEEFKKEGKIIYYSPDELPII